MNNIAQAARDYGVSSIEQDPEPESMFWPFTVIIGSCAAFIVLCITGVAAHAGII